MDDYPELGIELAEPDPLDGGTVLQSMQAESPELLAGGLPFSRCTQAVRQAVDAAKMTADFVIVTRTKDVNRHGNMVQIAPSKFGQGLRLDEYQHNPVVLLDHGVGHSLPIGLSAPKDGDHTVKLQKTKATARVFFSQTSQVAEDVFRLVEEGTLRMSSIGFMPTKAMRVKQRRQEQLPDGVESLAGYVGYDFVEAMLWEWSITAIGADAGALRQCLDCGEIGGKKFHPLLRPMMQRYAEERQAWSPGFGDGQRDPLEAMLQRIGDHLTERVTQAVERRLLAASGSDALDAEMQRLGDAIEAADLPPEPAPQATCGCQQKKDVDSTVQAGTTPEPSALEPVVTPQQIAQAMRPQPTGADQLAAIVRQAVTDTITPAVASIANEQQRLAERVEQMTGALPE